MSMRRIKFLKNYFMPISFNIQIKQVDNILINKCNSYVFIFHFLFYL